MTSTIRLVSTGTLVACIIYACSLVLVVQLGLRKYHDARQTRRKALCGARDATIIQQKNMEAFLIELRKGDKAYAKSVDDSSKSVIALANSIMMLFLYFAFLSTGWESYGKVVCFIFGIGIYFVFNCKAALSVLVVLLAMRYMLAPPKTELRIIRVR